MTKLDLLEWTSLDWIRLFWTGVNSTELNLTELEETDLLYITLDRTELNLNVREGSCHYPVL